jgi:hypothetical protein
MRLSGGGAPGGPGRPDGEGGRQQKMRNEKRAVQAQGGITRANRAAASNIEIYVIRWLHIQGRKLRTGVSRC